MNCRFDVPPVDPVMMNKINDKTICRTRGGKEFEQVTRPDQESGECPEGTSPCSTITSIENTVCYPQDQHATQCPITFMEIVDEATGDAKKSDENFAVVDYRTRDP